MADEMVMVNKVDLVEGEELMDLAKKVMTAVTQQRGKLKKSLFLTHIFGNHIVVKDAESGKSYRMPLSRSEKGDVKLGDMEEVRAVFVSVREKADKGDKTEEDKIQDAGERVMEILDDIDRQLDGEESVLKVEGGIASLVDPESTNIWKNHPAFQ